MDSKIARLFEPGFGRNEIADSGHSTLTASTLERLQRGKSSALLQHIKHFVMRDLDPGSVLVKH